MCRTDRRCDLSCEQKEEHNRRRRVNRAFARQVVALAEAMGADGVEKLRSAAGHGRTREARIWLAEHDGSYLLGEGVTQTEPLGDSADATERARSLTECLRSQPTSAREARLLAGQPEVRWSQAPTQGANSTRKVSIRGDDGTVVYGFHKPIAGEDIELAGEYGHTRSLTAVHEVAASRLADGLGPPWASLVPAAVLREVDGEIGSLSEAVPGRPLAHSTRAEAEDGARAANGHRDAAFFDALIGQQDRNPGNWLAEENGTLHLIDHGFTFCQEGEHTGWNFMQRARGFEDALQEHEIAALDRFLSSPDGLGTKPLLQPERYEAMRVRAHRMRETGHTLPATGIERK